MPRGGAATHASYRMLCRTFAFCSSFSLPPLLVSHPHPCRCQSRFLLDSVTVGAASNSHYWVITTNVPRVGSRRHSLYARTEPPGDATGAAGEHPRKRRTSPGYLLS